MESQPQNPEFRINPENFHPCITCTLCTTLLVSSNNDIAVDVENDVAPLCRPRTIRPSFLYCSTGSQNKSFIPCATKET